MAIIMIVHICSHETRKKDLKMVLVPYGNYILWQELEITDTEE